MTSYIYHFSQNKHALTALNEQNLYEIPGIIKFKTCDALTAPKQANAMLTRMQACKLVEIKQSDYKHGIPFKTMFANPFLTTSMNEFNRAKLAFLFSQIPNNTSQYVIESNGLGHEFKFLTDFITLIEPNTEYWLSTTIFRVSR